MMKFNLTLVLILSLFAFSVLANNTTPYAQHWDTASGLNHNSVYDINKDPLGRAWLATPNGVNIIDGLGVINLNSDTQDNTAGLSSNVITRVIAYQDKMYVLSLAGIDIVDPYTLSVSHVNDPQSLLQRANHLAFTSDQQAFIIAKNKFLSWNLDRGAITELTLDAQISTIYSIVQASSKKLTLATEEGYFTYTPSNGEFSQLFTEPSPVKGKDRRYSFLDKYDRLWVSVFSEGVYVIKDNKVIKHLNSNNSLASDFVSKIFTMGEDIYILTRRGISVYQQDSVKHKVNILPKSNSNTYMQAEMALTAFTPSHNNLWIGTTNGFYSLKLNSMDFSILKPKNTEIFGHVFESYNKLYSLSNETITQISPQVSSDYESLQVGNVIMADDNLFLMAEGTVKEFKNGQLSELVLQNDIDSKQFTGVFKQLIDEQLVISSQNEVFLYKKNKTELQLVERFYLGSTNVADAKVINQQLYIASQRQGLLVIDLTQSKGLKTAKLRVGPRVPFNLTLDKQQRLWVQSLDNGVFTIDTTEVGEAKKIIKDSQFQPNCIVSDDQNRIWLVGTQGISILQPDLKDKTWLGDSDGFNPSHATIESCGFVDGKVFISTKSEVYIYTPNDESIHKADSKLAISTVFKDLKPYRNNNKNEFQQPSLLRFWVYTDDLMLTKNSQLLFRVKNLKKQDTRLDSHWNNTRSRDVTLLQPTVGEYLLEYKVVTPDGATIIANSTKFAINPPFYLRTEMFIFYVICLLGIVVLFFTQKLKSKNKTLHLAKLSALKQQKYNIKLAREVREKTEQYKIQRQVAVNANIDKTRFIASASHDLRAPLNAIRWQLQQLLDDDEPNKKQVMDELLMLDQLVESIVNLAKFDTKQIKANFDNVDLICVINEVESRFQQLANERKVNLVFNTSVSHALIKSDSFLASRLVNNLVDNAIKNSAVGKTVELKIVPFESGFCLKVIDNSGGLPDVVKNNLYKTFIRGTQSYLGSGLGLAIVKQIADVLAVKLTVDSDEFGTCFSIMFAQGDAQKYLNSKGGDKKISALIIDNDSYFANDLENMLTPLGFSTDTITHIEVDKISQLVPHYDLLLFDYNLGINESGLLLAKRLKDSFKKNSLVILMSEDASLRGEVRAQSDFIFLSKPVKKNKLSWVIQSLLKDESKNE